MKLSFISLVLGAIILFTTLLYCIITFNPYNSAFALVFGVPIAVLLIGYYFAKQEQNK